jgi:tetratricopeptide (TPR) repeat protein
VSAQVQAEAARKQAEANAEEARRQEKIAEGERDTAQQRFVLARDTVDRVVFRFAQGFKEIEGVRIDVLQNVLVEARGALDLLAKVAPEDLALQRSRAAMLSEFGDALRRAGSVNGAREAYSEALEITRRIFLIEPNNIEWQRNVGVMLDRLGDIARVSGDLNSAHNFNLESLGIARRLLSGAQ